MQPSPRPGEKRARLAPEVRRDQILAVAAKMVLDQGCLPLNLEALARAAGISKALVYAVFGDQHALFNALLEQDLRALAARGVADASMLGGLHEAALGCALAYFEHVAATGPLIHVILRDPYMAGQVDPAVAAARDRVVRRLARLAREELRLPAKEAIAAINLIITIPEEAGRLVKAGTLSPERGRLLCRELVESSLEALSPQVNA